ncbi:unnamed protein product [Coccothraustes coccothraustes]
MSSTENPRQVLSIPLGSLRTSDSHLRDGAGTLPCLPAPARAGTFQAVPAAPRTSPALIRFPRGERGAVSHKWPCGRSRFAGTGREARPRSAPAAQAGGEQAEGGSHTASGEEGVAMLHICGSQRSAESYRLPEGSERSAGHRRLGIAP